MSTEVETKTYTQLDYLSKLKKDDLIQYRMDNGKWIPAKIIWSKESSFKLKIRYKSSLMIDYTEQPFRFAPHEAERSMRYHLMQNMEVGDFVDINPTLQHPNIGWVSGQIRKKSYQRSFFDVRYNLSKDGVDTEYKYYVYFNDNGQEIAPFTSKCASTLKIPYPQSSTRSKQIVLEFVRECTKLFPKNKNAFIQVIPLPIAHCILSFYHSDVIYPSLSPSSVNTKYNISDKIKFGIQEGSRYSINTLKCSWTDALVIDKHDNWIKIEYCTHDQYYPEKVHKCMNVTTENDLIYKALPEDVLNAVENINGRVIDIGDKGGLFAIFATELVGDLHVALETETLSMFEKQYRKYYQENKAYFDEWELSADDEETGNFAVLSDFCHVRINIYEYDEEDKKLFEMECYGFAEETRNAATISILRYEDSYYLIWHKDREHGLNHSQPIYNCVLKHNEDEYGVNFQLLRMHRVLKEREERIQELLANNDNN